MNMREAKRFVRYNEDAMPLQRNLTIYIIYLAFGLP